MKKVFLLIATAVAALSFASCGSSGGSNNALLALLYGSTGGLSVVSTTPENSATNVAINSSIAVTFSDAISDTTVSDTTFTVSPSVTGTFTVTGASVIFKPDSDLSANTEYMVTLTTGIGTVAGSILKKDYSFSFTTGTTADETAPTVSSTTPADDATDVAVNSSIVITFSEPINASTVAGNYTVSPALTDPEITVTGNTLTINPDADLDYSTLYTVTFVASGIEDLAGNALASEYEFTFTTSAEPDTTGPSVFLTTPVDEATNKSVKSKIYVYFSENIDSSSVNSTTFSISPSVAGTFSVTDSAVVFTPSADMEYNTTYTVTLPEGGIKDLSDNGLEEKYSFSFTTIATEDLTAPTITSFSPENDATGVKTIPTVTIYFSEPVDEETLNSTNFYVTYDNSGTPAAVAGTLAYMEVYTSYCVMWTPSSRLSYNTEYTITMPLGGITDLAGNGWTTGGAWTTSGNFVITFTTKEVPDTTAPTIVSTTPTDDGSATIASMTFAGFFGVINIMFSDEMEATTFTESTAVVTRGATVINTSATTGFSSDGKTVTLLIQLSDLLAGSYSVSLIGGDGGIANSDGVEMESNYSFNFTCLLYTSDA
ncbi:MAG: Ig-like domain-containing protein, partial [Bacteroidota bacterium]|nr:Ig-like domain-containing protein [Bacteroidota bacterium]